MPKHTQRAARQLIRELKDYSFEQSQDFRDGTSQTLEVTKTLEYPPIGVEINNAGNLEFFQHEMGRTSFSLLAVRHRDERDIYDFTLKARVEQPINRLSDNLKYVLPKRTKKTLKRAIRLDETDVTETLEATYSITEYDLSEVTSTERYLVKLEDDCVYESSEHDVLYPEGQRAVVVPAAESPNKMTRLWLPIPIEHERYTDDVDRLENELAFRAIVGLGLSPSTTNLVVTTDEAAARLRAVLEQLKSGRLA